MNAIKFSRFLKFYENEESVGIFHQINPDPIVLKKSNWESFKKDPSSYPRLKKIFTERGLIIKDDFEDEKLINESKMELINRLNDPKILYLMTAQHCNIKCDYCPIPEIAKNKGNNLLSKENAIMGLELWFNHIKSTNYTGPLWLIFYGGEPLLNFTVIKEVVDYLQEKKQRVIFPNINIMIATNGLLINEEIMFFFKKYNFFVSIGIDGFTPETNSKRLNSAENDTSFNLISKIKTMSDMGITIGASVSITEDNLNEIKNFSTKLNEIGVTDFGFNFLKGKALENLKISNGEYFKRASNAIIENYQMSEGKSIDAQINRKINSYNDNLPFPADCTCYGNQIVIQADGYITNCPFYRNDIKHISEVDKNFLIHETKEVQDWRNRLPLLNDKYLKESSMSLCGGGCTWSQLDQNKEMLTIDENQFIFSEITLKYLIFKTQEEELI
ncbi:MAG: radical SAM protein [Candidatus Pacebacteria bacterium]|nr:radical SAM protein [Candidatus Paceibacterota bacterium]